MLGHGSDAMPGYQGEPFTGDGTHFIGQDGFVVPANFIEFYDRYPVYVRNWVSKKLRKCSSHPDVEDWVQTLLAHLFQLYKGRVVKGLDGEDDQNIGGILYKLGFTDVIHAYNPWAHYGASARRFFNFVNLCLNHKYLSLRSKYRKDATSHSLFSLDSQVSGDKSEDPVSGSASREYLLIDRSSLYRSQVVENRNITADGIFIQQFKDFVGHREPELLSLVDAIMSKDKVDEILISLDYDQNRYLRDRKRLIRLSKSFQTGG
jgi:hypothetical protein